MGKLMPLLRGATLLLGGAVAASGATQPAAPAPNVRDAVWSPDGRRLAFVSDRTGTFQVYVARADGGDARQVTTGTGPFFYPEFSPDGKRLVAMQYRDPEVVVFTMNADGSDQKGVTPAGQFNADPRFSAGGDHILLHGRRDGRDDIFIMKADGTDLRKITDEPSAENTPVPSPDGTRLVCVTDRAGGLGLLLMNLDGSSPRMLTNDPRRNHLVPKWSPDSRRIAYYSMDREAGPTSAEIYVLDVASGAQRRITNNQFRDQGPAWSPDASRLVFTSVRDGRMGLYTVDLSTLQEEPLDVRYAPAPASGSAPVPK